MTDNEENPTLTLVAISAVTPCQISKQNRLTVWQWELHDNQDNTLNI